MKTYEQVAEMFASIANLGRGAHHGALSTTRANSPSRKLYAPARPDTAESMPYSAWNVVGTFEDVADHVRLIAELGESRIYHLAPKRTSNNNSVDRYSLQSSDGGGRNYAKPQAPIPQTQTRLVIDDAFIREWEPQYDRIESDEPEYQRLASAVGREIASLGTISKDTFMDIWRWKGAIRSIRHVLLDQYDTLYAEAFRRAYAEVPERKLEILYGLPGVLGPTGSTLIHFMSPDTMPIIDVRTVGVLSKAGLINSRSCDLSHYNNFRRAIEGIRNRCPGWTLRQIDRAFFAYHKVVMDQAGESCFSQ